MIRPRDSRGRLIKAFSDEEIEKLRRLYWEKGKSIEEIAKSEKRNVKTIWGRMARYGIPRRIATKNGGLLRPPDLSPSPELVYLLGVRYGDMILCKYVNKRNPRNIRYLVGLHCKDREFVEEFERCLVKIIHKKKEYSIQKKKDGLFELVVSNKELHRFMTKSLEMHKTIIEAYPARFLMAFFDSEGTVYKCPHRGWPMIEAANINLPLLRYVRNLLKRRFDINSRIYRKPRQRGHWSDSYRLDIFRKDSFLKFVTKVGFIIKRKQDRLKIKIRSDAGRSVAPLN